MDPGDQIILFDGVCNLCNGLVKFIIKRDPHSKFKFCPLQSSLAKSLLKELNLDAGEINTVVFINGEKCFIKSSAILHIFNELGGHWKLIYVFILVPAFLRDFVYRLIAKSRYRVFGKRDVCLVPDENVRSRFLE